MEHKCLKEGEIAAIKENVVTIFKRMDKMESKQDAQYKMAEAVAVLAEKMGGLREDVKDMKDEVSSVKKDVETVKREVQDTRLRELEGDAGIWHKFKWLFVTGVVGLTVGYFFNLIVGG